MMTTQSIPENTLSQHSVTALHAPRRADRREATATIGDGVAMVAFDALLDTARAAAPASTAREATGRTAASQMFEAAGGDAHERRQAALKDDYVSSATGSKGRAPGAADVENRLAANAERSATAPQRGDDLAPGSKTLVSIDSRTESGRHAPSAEDSAELPRFDRGARVAGRGNASASNTRYASPSSPDMTNGDANPSARAAGAAPAAQPALAVEQIGASNSSSAQSPAQRVASLLASARGGTETTRAPAPTAAATDARQPGGDQKTAGRSPDQSAASRRSDQAPTRLAESGRSAFDQLVRSIRLQTGARRSFARIQLDPPELGRVRVDVRVEGDQLRIEVHTEHRAARDVLSEKAEHLTRALERRGLTVERFDVTSDPIDNHAHGMSSEMDQALNDPATYGEQRREEEVDSQARPINADLLESVTMDETDIAEPEMLAAQAGRPDRRLDIRV